MSWAVADYYDFYSLRHWWAVPILLAGAIAGGLILARQALGPAAALIAGVAAGLAEHAWRTPVTQSDTLWNIRGAFNLLRTGQNPYGVLIENGVPPGTFQGPVPPALFAYPPGPFIVYGPAITLGMDLSTVERVSAILTILLIAALAWRVGPGRAALGATLFGTFTYASFRALDSSNDTTIGLLFIVGTLLLWQWERRGRWAREAYVAAVPVFALALLSKQLGWFIYLPIALHLWFDPPGGRRHVMLTAALAAAAILPFFVWGPAALVGAFILGVTAHQSVYGLNLLGMIAAIDKTLADRLSIGNNWILAAGAAITIAGLIRWRARSIPVALAQGCLLMFVVIFLAGWSSPAYYLSLAALLALLVAITPFGSTTPHPGAEA